MEKVLKFNEFANQYPEKFREALGLDVSNIYFHVSIESFNSTSYKKIPVKYRDGDNVRNLLDAGYPLPEGGFVRYERYIWLRPDLRLLGVLYINTEKGALPTPVCEASNAEQQGVECRFNLNYPLTELYVTIYRVYNWQSAGVSICIYKTEPAGQGACPLGEGGISVKISEQGRDDTISSDIPSELPAHVYNGTYNNNEMSFLDFVNSKLKDELNLTESDPVYIQISVRHVDAEIVILDNTMARHIAGKAAAKLVVYTW